MLLRSAIFIPSKIKLQIFVSLSPRQQATDTHEDCRGWKRVHERMKIYEAVERSEQDNYDVDETAAEQPG